MQSDGKTAGLGHICVDSIRMRRDTYIINVIIQGSLVSEQMPVPEDIREGFWWKIITCLRHVQVGCL